MNQTLLAQAKNRAAVFEKFLQIELDQEANASQLAFLDRGIENSPYQVELSNYPIYLEQKPMDFSPYPSRGKVPKINTTYLNFLDPEILQACVCVGRFIDDQFQTIWMIKNALESVQFRTTTKIIAGLNILSQVNTKFPDAKIGNWVFRDPQGRKPDFSFVDAMADIVSYRRKIATSNALSGMLKRFESRSGLERWLIKITGNQNLEFRGDYGEDAFIQNPRLVDAKSQKVLLSAVEDAPRGQNLLSAYDLTRIISMVGWHYHLTPEAQLPGVTWETLKYLIPALGQDTARFVDVALDALGLTDVIYAPVILSKLGHGPSQVRNSIETTYVAFVQFIDRLPSQTGQATQPSRLRTISMTLRGAIPITNFQDYNQESIRLDARMAAEVTEILRRLVSEEFNAIA
ncbi:hypothetical protein B9T07_01190 [Limnospira fusiformis CCALA 023]|uniref:hypothetical protein n=1 Tax=Oscillatoriales TaxID=1150 RepID=UPI00396DF139